jgi:hypothetical protein
MTQPSTPPGWYPDPNGAPGQRYFDGTRWTENRAAPQMAPVLQRPRRKVWPWVLGGIFLVIFLVIGGCVAFVGSVANEIAKDSPVTVQSPNGGTQTADSGPSFPGKQDGDTGVEAGGSVTSDDVTTTASALSTNSQYGSTYLCTAVTIQNGGNKPATFNSAFDWKLQDPTGTTRMASLMGSDNNLSAGEVAPGGTAKGDVCFEDKSGSATGTYVVLFDPTFRLSSSRIGWINTL